MFRQLFLICAFISSILSESAPEVRNNGVVFAKPPLTVGGAQTYSGGYGGGSTNTVGGQGGFFPGNGGQIGGQGSFPEENSGNEGFGGNVGGSGYYPGGNVGGSGYFPGGTSSGSTVAFSALRANRYTQSSPSAVRFDRTITDVGFGWDATQGVFSCYYPGVYVFSWSAVSPRGREFRLSLVKNGYEVAHAWSEQDGYQAGSNSIVLSLQQGDKVQLKVTEGQLYEPSTSNRGYTTFTGYKI